MPFACSVAERCLVMRLLLPALRIAKARQQRLAVEHDRGIGREDEIRNAGGRRHELDRRAEESQRLAQPVPFAMGLLRQRALVVRAIPCACIQGLISYTTPK